MSKLGNIPATSDIALTNDALPAGSIVAWPSSTPPNLGWLLCDGPPHATIDYPSLSALLNGAFDTAAGMASPGAGNFRTPPLVKSTVSGASSAGRVPVGILAGTDSMGSSGGGWRHGHSLGDLSLPDHQHGVSGPDGQMRCTHGHNWTPSPQTHTHFETDYWIRAYGQVANATWISGALMTSVTTGIGGGVYDNTAYVSGASAGASGWGLNGSFTQGQDGPYTGLYWYIKT